MIVTILQHPLAYPNSPTPLGPSYAFVSEWGAQRLHHPGPAGHAYRQGIARLAGVQQPWWCWQSLNTQWGWQGRGSCHTILLRLLTTQWQTPMYVVGAPRERNGCRGTSLQCLWERNGNNNTQCKRGTSTVDTPWGRGRDAVALPWTPC